MNTQRWQPNQDKFKLFAAMTPIAVGIAISSTSAQVAAQAVISAPSSAPSATTQSVTTTSSSTGSVIIAPSSSGSFTTGTIFTPPVTVIERGSSIVNYSTPTSSFIYGSPIPTPVPVNPATGLTPSTTYYSYPIYNYSYPSRETVISPSFNILINPRSPVIVNDSGFLTPSIGRSRIIFGNP